MPIARSPSALRRARHVRRTLVFCVLLLIALLCPRLHAEIVFTPSEDRPERVTIRRGAAHLAMSNSWSSFSLKTRRGKGISLVDPVLYGVSGSNIQGLYWCERGWPRLKWVAAEQSDQRDVVYVEGEYEGWRVQAWVAMEGDEEAAYVRKRITRLRGTRTLNSARGVMAQYHGEDGLKPEELSVVVDGVDGLPARAIKQYLLYRRTESSVAVVNPGEEFQKRGNRYGHFGDFIYHPKPRFLEASLHLGAADMKAGNFVEYTFILLWGDGDISDRVKAVLADAKMYAARLPAAERPAVMDEPEPIEPPWPTDRPHAAIDARFYARTSRTRRVWTTGPRLAAPPVVDGKFDDDAWQGAWGGDFVIHDTGNVRSDIRTSFQVRHDARALYLAVQCDQPHLGKVRLAAHKPDRYSAGEQIELFLRASKHAYQICVDPNGGWYDSRDERVAFFLEWKVAVVRDDKGWAFEAEIPFAALGMKPAQAFDWYGFNIARGGGQPEMPHELSSWNPAMGQFAGVDNFGTLFFGTEAQYLAEQGFALEPLLDRDVYDTLDAAAGAYVKVIATDGIPEGTRLLAAVTDKAGQFLRTSQHDVTGNEAGLALDLEGLEPGEYEARFALIAAGKQGPPARVPFRIRKNDRVVKGSGRIPIAVRSAHASAQMPVSMGVPFPKGELTDPTRIRLRDAAGQEIPYAGSALTRWDPAGSVAWLRLHFQTPIETEQTLSLEYGADPGQALAPVAVAETPAAFTVNTGPLQFTVPRTHGGVLGSAHLDMNGDGRFDEAEQMVAGPKAIGPYLVDGNGKRYDAARDPEARVVMEERNALRVVFRIEGWYQAEHGAKLCKHVTRLTAFRGLPHVRLEHTWIMTAATGEAVFKDIGFALPTSQAERVVFGTEDGLFADYPAYPRHLLQDTDLHYEIHGPYRRLAVPDKDERAKLRHRAFVEGGKAPGWIGVKGDRGGVVLAVDEFWQNFPKEIGLEGGVLAFHVWPKHGRPRNRPVTDATITKLDWVHAGETLDFALPPKAANHKTANEHEQYFVKTAARANAIGTAKTHRLALTFFPADVLIPDAAEEARAVADTPCAAADPGWVAASGVFGPLHPRDPESFPEVEKAFDRAARIVPRLNHLDGHYGMWIYGQLHTDYCYPAHRWAIYRLFNQLHHNGPRWPWIMFFRSGHDDIFDFALANARICADVSFCHYSRPEFEKLPYPFGKMRGALTDYKGLVPWHSGNRNPDYNSLSAFLMWHYYMTGDGWTRDVAEMWGDLAVVRGPAGGFRSGSGTLRASMDLYAATWDARLIPVYRKTARALSGSQLEHGAFPSWENYAPWLGDYARFTGQADARDALIKWSDAFYEGHGDIASNGSGWGMYMNVPANAYFASGDKRHARYARGLLETWLWGIHADEESHLVGNYPGPYALEMSFFGNLLVRGPQALAAWADAGKDIAPLFQPSLVEGRKQKDGSHKLDALLLEERDGAIALSLGGELSGKDPGRNFPISVRVIAPNGETALVKEIVVAPRVNVAHGSSRAYARDWARLRVPADGLRGLYRVRITSAESPFRLRLPVSDVKEACRMPSLGHLVLHERTGSMVSFHVPAHVERIGFAATVHHRVPVTVQLRDPVFRVKKRVFLMGGDSQSNRRAVALDLPADHGGGVWTVISGVSPHMSVDFTGPWQPTYFSITPERAFDVESHLTRKADE